MTATDAMDPAVRLAVLRAVKDEIAAAEREAKQQWHAALERLKHPQIDGTVLTTIYEGKGRVEVSVDEDVLTDWVEEHYPTEVEQTTRVRPAFLAAIKERSKQAGQACLPDGTLDVPGVLVSVGDPFVGVRKPSEEATALIVALQRQGLISLSGEVLRQIEEASS